MGTALFSLSLIGVVLKLEEIIEEAVTGSWDNEGGSADKVNYLLGTKK